MQHFDSLNSVEQDYLKLVARGDFSNVDIVPAVILLLVIRGYVEAVPLISFPVTPPRCTLRLTLAGENLLSKIPQ